MKEKLDPDYLFEVSWEVCNKVGGIYTVVSTKALNMGKELGDKHILIGPDVWRDTETNPDFIEDPRLLKAWHAKAIQEGLRIRIGRWNVAGNPVAVLVDFSSFIVNKDAIFGQFWETYKLDSISGQWDYIEPALFGYAAGKVIESYTNFNLSPRHRVVAQFHEWMTGTGLLYLHSAMPQIGCIFTTHATVMGRCIAGNNLPLYDQMESYNPDEKARQFNIVSKQSLERTAAQAADCFTTVSGITARECIHFLGKAVDIVTPNGFENSFTPTEEEFPARQAAGRAKLREVAAALLNRPVADDAFFVGISGRYEYCNKGIDVFIDALAELNRDASLTRETVAFIMVPAGHHGPNKELLYNLQNPAQRQDVFNRYVTHYLSDPEYDPSLRRFAELLLRNSRTDRVSIVFVPSYLNGYDGVFNRPYYDLLVGLDATVFPSYYEPWGYTPLESLAFKVPTITTSLAGFGLWVEEKYRGAHPSIEIIRRNDVNNDYVVACIAKKLKEFIALTPDEMRTVKENAKDVSTIALWDNHIKYYKKAAAIALQKVTEHAPEIATPKDATDTTVDMPVAVNQPHWVQVMVHKHIPESLSALEELSKNLWWCWNQDAVELFASIDPVQWKASGYNPVALFDMISLSRYRELEKETTFVQKLKTVYAQFTDYMAAKNTTSGPHISYFSMEYGLHTSLKIYSGGLGILAGDYLKEASDSNVRMTGIGLLYRYGYFTQKLSAAGDQEHEYDPQDYMKIPAVPVRDRHDKWLTAAVSFPGRTVHIRVWRVDVGRVALYLLDTDFEDNLPEDRSITHHLYGGNLENRLKQEMILGIGGIRVLRTLNVDDDVYHCNEGHAAFIGLERLREYVMDENLMFTEALEVVRGSSLFTTHTPVPAGHDAFSENLLRTYMSHYPDRLKISWEQMMSLGKIHPGDPNEKFSMSYLAANLSQEINGVSWLHGKVSREILKDLWPGYLSDELEVGYVTNGVHYPTWTAPEWKEIHAEVFGKDFQTHHYDKRCFQGIYNVDGARILATRNKLRKKLIAHIKEALNSSQSYLSPKQLIEVKETLRDDVLTIGFARRFATYKRACLLFSDIEQLSAIVNHPEYPVQFIYAGKAHPADKAGQDLIKRIVEVSKMPQFIGKIIFVPNYDIEIAKLLVQGVDVWMNTPTRPLEASGTSGEKAVMNGVMHFSVLDGWWVEGFKENAGWALPMERAYENQTYQDELDAASIYNIIEDEIVPAYYHRDANGLPQAWITHIKNTVANVASNFTTNRMLEDYLSQFYLKLHHRHRSLVEADYALATELAEWKKKVKREWDPIELIGEDPGSRLSASELGCNTSLNLSLYIGELKPEDVGVEMVIAKQDKNGRYQVVSTVELTFVSCKDRIATYHLDFVPDVPGTYFMARRLFAKNPLLPHRQDFPLVKWV
ncbi:MAG: alpha-glucan family phosphorylase [Prevotellaceae bacterium]|jgi:phosphorylase/glycogen(starch) synthase|nr:alpha-glucan family phosphorylase [Prevotellaceae bacterium]